MTQRRALIAGGVVLGVLVVLQLVGPWVAGRVVRGMLDDRGTVVSAKVSAFPAVKLLWHKADSVTVHMSSLTLGTGDIGTEIEKTRDAGEVSVRIDEGVLGPLRLTDLRFDKRGNALTGGATVSDENLSDAFGVDLEPVASPDGSLTVRASVLGFSGDGTLTTQDGKLRVTGAGLLSGFVGVDVFDDPRVVATAVDAVTRPGGFTVTVDGRLP